MMNTYDDMCALPNSDRLREVCSRNTASSTSSTPTSSLTTKRTYLWKAIGWAKISILVLLLINPASAVPVNRWRRTATTTTTNTQLHRLPHHHITQEPHHHHTAEPQQHRQLHHTAQQQLQHTTEDSQHLTAQQKQNQQITQYLLEADAQAALELAQGPLYHQREGQALEQQQANSQEASEPSQYQQEEEEDNTIEVPHPHQTHSFRNRPHPSRRMGEEVDNAGASRGRREVPPHWSQPCTGLLTDESNTQQTLSTYIKNSVAVAHSQLNGEGGLFKNKFASEVLHIDTWPELEAHMSSTNFSFDFLVMPEPEDQSFNSIIVHSYEKMQRVAVGIEQVTLDQALYQGSMLSDFRQMETYIVKILCNLHYAMVHHGLTPKAEVTKEIMDERYRDLENNTSARNYRDAFIVMKYNDAIEYLKNNFSEFSKPAQ